MRFTTIVTLLAALAVPIAGLAQPAPEALRAGLLRQADQARGAGDHARAVTLLRAAAAIRPATPLRWALAFELLQLGDLPAARLEAQACVDGAGPGDATARAECLAIGDRAQARPSPASMTSPEPTLPPAVSPVAPAAQVAQPGVQAPSRAGPVALLVAGGLGVVAAVVLYALEADSLAACAVAGGEATCPTPQALAHARDSPTLALGGNLALGLGLASVAGGVVWWLLTGRPAERPRVALAPAGMVVRW